MPQHDKRTHVRIVQLNPCKLDYRDKNGNAAHQHHSHKTDNDLYRWRSGDGSIDVFFPHNTPFKNGLRRFQAGIGDWTQPTAEQDPAARAATYKYNVTVTTPAGDNCEEDPEIIIQDDLRHELRESTSTVMPLLALTAGIGLIIWGIRELRQ